MVTAFAQEARVAMTAPDEEEEVPDVELRLRQAERPEATAKARAGASAPPLRRFAPPRKPL